MRSNLHKIYYALALIDIVTIVLTLFLAFSIYKTYDESYVVNQQWVQRSLEYDHLTDLAIQANSPGNEVFKSRDVLKESQRFEKISKEIHTVESQLKKDAKENLGQYPEIAEKLEMFHGLIAQANQVTLNIFQKIERDKLSDAAVDMADMDAKFHAALLEASKLRTLVRGAQSEQLIFYHEKAESLFLKEIYIAVFIFILIGIMLYFGRNIKKNFDQLVTSLEEKNNKLSDSEKKLVAVLDNVLEAIILINDKGIIEYTNPQASFIFQYAESEMINKNVNILMPENYARNHDGYIKNYLKTSEAKVIGVGREVSGVKKKWGDILAGSCRE